MYMEIFLLTLRIAHGNGEVYFCGRVKSSHRKNIIYVVFMKIKNSFVTECQCECSVGKGPTAHCKHVCVIFEALKDFAERKCYNKLETCTKNLLLII